jgi:hypothetical protein
MDTKKYLSPEKIGAIIASMIQRYIKRRLCNICQRSLVNEQSVKFHEGGPMVQQKEIATMPSFYQDILISDRRWTK